MKKLNQETILSLHRITEEEHDKKIGLLKKEFDEKNKPEKSDSIDIKNVKKVVVNLYNKIIQKSCETYIKNSTRKSEINL